MTNDTAEPEGTVSSARLRSHVRFLKQWFQVVSLPTAVERLADGRPLREDLAVVTFDDGFAGNYEAAWPVLREERVPATIFVTTGFVDGEELWFDRARRSLGALERGLGQMPQPFANELTEALGQWPLTVDAAMEALKRLPPEARADFTGRLAETAKPDVPPARALSWDQVREMAASDDIEIGCHTVTHPILGQLTVEEQYDEIEKSRSRLAEQTGVVPSLFAYPNGAQGDFDDNTAEMLRTAGFTAACSTIRGSNRPGCDLFSLSRLGVGAESEDVLAARVGGLFDENVRARLLGGR